MKLFTHLLKKPLINLLLYTSSLLLQIVHPPSAITSQFVYDMNRKSFLRAIISSGLGSIATNAFASSSEEMADSMSSTIIPLII